MGLPSDTHLKWGAVGGTIIGVMFQGLAYIFGKEARQLENLPRVQSGKDLITLGRNRHVEEPGIQVAARGRLTSAEHFKADISQSKSIASVVSKQKVDTIRLSDGKWHTETRPLHTEFRRSELYLELEGDQKLLLKNPSVEDILPIMQQTVFKSESGYQGLLKRALDATLGFVTDYQKIEYILPPDLEITAVGTLVTNSPVKLIAEQKRYSLEPVDGHFKFSRSCVTEQVCKLDKCAKYFRMAAQGCGIIAVTYISIYIAKKVIKARSTRHNRKRKAEEEARFLKEVARRREARRSGNSGDNADWVCSVCYESEGGQTVFPACGHVAVCRNCARACVTCPICRTCSTPRLLFYS